MSGYSYLHNADNQYIESLYHSYKENPSQVDESWRKFFEGFDLGTSANGATKGVSIENADDEFKVAALVLGYRTRGHLLSTTNPIRQRVNREPKLELNDFGFSENDLEKEFAAGSLVGLGKASLKNIISHLKQIYTENIGVEYHHINNTEIREWFQNKFESTAKTINFSIDKKKRILQKLNEAVAFENFLSVKYVGQKRFSLEGGENTIPALDAIINTSGDLGVKEVVIGMAHRGRLNVLANILGKTYEYIFSEFEGIIEPELTMGDGDVKYHLGFSSIAKTEKGNSVNLKLMPNPSHLEAVDPVVTGYARGKMEFAYQRDKNSILPILIHGDAAIAGQGVVYETAQMSLLRGYLTGGTIHFVINNQIGFTTDFDDARSSIYSTSVALAIDSPVLHVNGDDAEAVVYAVELASEFRQKFNRDVFIDMVCYRKHGHNEADEPKFTQPQLYNLIAKHKNPREIYTQELVNRGEIEAELAKSMEKEFKGLLQEKLNLVRENTQSFKVVPLEPEWSNIKKSTPQDFEESPDTSVSKENLDKVFNALTILPKDFAPIQKVKKLIADRAKMVEEGEIDWALAELAAYGTLLLEGKEVRLSGQDCVRGTFSHRHAEVRNEKTGEAYNFLNSLEGCDCNFRVYNSLLSEYAVLGYEYGLSLTTPDVLAIWEAQFGDFSNGAQVIIDQYLSSGESKWQKMSGLTMFLPHGYEGQGPEHSNARPERYLQLCAEYNMIIANVTTAANFFHLLRRQLTWDIRKPLVVFTPKSLLRYPKVKSNIKEFTSGKFREVIDDENAKPKKVKRVILCTGKIYYDLLEKVEEQKLENIALVRLEQLYPWPETQVNNIVAKYKDAEIMWVQEEPRNMGAWPFITTRELEFPIKAITRKASASPATGYNKVHVREQEDILNKALMLS